MQTSLLRWVGLAGLVLVVGVVAWALLRGTYKGDIQKVCNAERNAGVTMQQHQPAVVKWTTEHLDTPEATKWFNDLAKKPLGDRGKALGDEAKRLGITSCPTADSYDALATEAQFASEIGQLCTLTEMAQLELLTDDERLAHLKAWGDKAKSPQTKDLLSKLAAAAPKDRPSVLRATANDHAIYQCELATTLAKPPPPKELAAVRATEAEATTELTQQDVLDRVKPSVPALNQCYATASAKQKVNQGAVVLRLVVEPHGKVTLARPVSGPPNDKELADCLAKALESTSFGDTKAKVNAITLRLEIAGSPGPTASAPASDAGAH